MTRRYTKTVAAEVPAAPPVPKTIIVLCCHRGGGSVVAGVLNYLGVDMGRGNFIAPNAENPTGYFEDARITLMNDKILKACGTSWMATEQPANLRDVWPRFSKHIKQLRNRHWASGWKDPRTVLTLPLYQNWVNNPHYVIVLREPQAVAQSLQRREGWAGEQALDFTARYYHLIRRVAKELTAPKLEVRYEKLIADPKTEIERLARFVGMKGSVPEDFIDARLNHFVEPKPTVSEQHSDNETEEAEDPSLES